MGYEKIKRPLLLPGGMEVAGGSTFTGAVTHSAAVTGAVQTLSSVSTATAITNYGVTTIWQTTAGTTDQTWKLAAPELGVRKTIMFNPGGRTITITSTATGTDPFNGSTNTTSLVATSDADDFATMGVIDLVGVTATTGQGTSGTRWGIVHLTTAISIA